MSCFILLVRVVLVIALTLAANGQQCGVEWGIYEDGSCTTLAYIPGTTVPNPNVLKCGECIDNYFGSGQGAECMSCGNGKATTRWYPKGCNDKSDYNDQTMPVPSPCSGGNNMYFQYTCI